MFVSKIPGVTGMRIMTFILCFIQYVFIHCCRSTWSYVSGRMTQEPYNYFTSNYLGYINFAFLFFYGAAISLIGQFGDRMSLKVFILTGTFTTSIVFALIGILLNYEAKHNYMFMILQIINGISQSTAWPGLLAILNNWFMTDKKVILLGYFAACPNVGNIVGDFYSGSLVGKDDLPLYAPIYSASVSLFIINVINVFALKNCPDSEIKQQMIQEYEQAKKVPTKQQESVISLIDMNADQLNNSKIQKPQSEYLLPSQQEQKQQLNYLNAWFVPNVAVYALAFGCVKAVYYILGFWLPSYLDQKDVPDVAWITAMTDVGSIPGGIIICVIGYYFDKRAVIIVPALWIGTIIMISINFGGNLTHQIAGYMSLIFLTGLFIGGCYNNISSAMTVELSNQPELKKNKSATTTVVSVIMGYAAMFAAINQLIVPHVENHLFLYCGALSIIGGIFLIPLMLQEIKRMKLQRKQMKMG